MFCRGECFVRDLNGETKCRYLSNVVFFSLLFSGPEIVTLLRGVKVTGRVATADDEHMLVEDDEEDEEDDDATARILPGSTEIAYFPPMRSTSTESGGPFPGLFLATAPARMLRPGECLYMFGTACGVSLGSIDTSVSITSVQVLYKCCTSVQVYKGTQGYKGIVQGYKGTRVQVYKGTRVQGYKGPRWALSFYEHLCLCIYVCGV